MHRMKSNMKPPAQRISFTPGFHRSIRNYVLCLAAVPLLAASFAQGQSLNIKLWTGGTFTGGWSPAIINTGSGYVVNNVSYNPASANVFCHDMTVGFDPFISASVDIVNTTTAIQT